MSYFSIEPLVTFIILGILSFVLAVMVRYVVKILWNMFDSAGTKKLT